MARSYPSRARTTKEKRISWWNCRWLVCQKLCSCHLNWSICQQGRKVILELYGKNCEVYSCMYNFRHGGQFISGHPVKSCHIMSSVALRGVWIKSTSLGLFSDWCWNYTFIRSGKSGHFPDRRSNEWLWSIISNVGSAFKAWSISSLLDSMFSTTYMLLCKIINIW